MFKTKPEFYKELFTHGLTNECREYMHSLTHSELLDLIVELDYQLWKRCRELACGDEDSARNEYESSYECMEELIGYDKREVIT